MAIRTGKEEKERERWTDDITSIFERLISAPQLLLGMYARARLPLSL